MAKKRWKWLEQCSDFKKLKSYFSDETLDGFEQEIVDYLNGEIDTEDETLAVCWFEGVISAEDLAYEYSLYGLTIKV